MKSVETTELTMSKLYVGNLSADVSEYSLRQLFLDNNISCGAILVKRGGYAFVDCPDQSSADRAIDKLNAMNIFSGFLAMNCTELNFITKNPLKMFMAKKMNETSGQGYNFQGSLIVVEPSVAGGSKKRGSGGGDSDSPTEQLGNGWSGNCKIIVNNIPVHVAHEDLEPIFSQFGSVQNCERINSRDASYQTYQVIYETQDQAQQAVNQLNGYKYENQVLKAEFAMERRRGGGRGGSRGGGGAYGGPAASARQTDFPLRILVQSDMVGAIIGRQGTTIRQITQQTRARVDVHRKDNVGSLEKAITIYGNPDNCTNACKKILEVMQAEASNTNKGEISLKILAHNNLIGRIIGKGGNTIKRIMQDTDSKITVSSINDINSFNLERIITVKGTIDNMSRAESMISAKLRQSYENDLQAMAPQSMMFPGLHPMAMMSTNNMGYSSRGPGAFGGVYGSGAPMPYPPIYPPAGPQQGPSQGGDSQETTFLFIPNNAVGAIIGTRGTHIRNIIRFSGASVKIASLDQEKGSEQPIDRKVTIIGNPESQWKAQYLIFEKMREEGFIGSGSDDVKLTVEILVPSSQVGRIIGKGGQNVRELQRLTGSIIKLPEQGASPPTQEETSVHIIGPFYSVQSAQRRIRAMVLQPTPGGGARGGPPRRERE